MYSRFAPWILASLPLGGPLVILTIFNIFYGYLKGYLQIFEQKLFKICNKDQFRKKYFEDIENLPEFFSIRRHKVSSMIKEEVKESIYKYSKKKTSR